MSFAAACPQLLYCLPCMLQGEYVQEVWTARLAQALGVDVAGAFTHLAEGGAGA